MKILFLSHKFFPDVGGIEVNSEILANGFVREGHQVRLLTWTKENGEKNFPFEINRNPGLKQLLKAHKWADIVYENNPCLRLAWPSFFLKKPYVVALRTWVNRMDGKISWQDKLKIYSLSKASAVIAVSEAVRKRIFPKATVIGNPYRQELFRQIPDIKISRDFVFLGRLVSDKGADLAIKALHQLNSVKDIKKSDFSLTIIGDGEEMKNLRMLVEKMGLNSQVIFTGSLRGEELVNCLNEHRYILVPSIWEEPFGNVALEGMACGCLPIVSDGGGLPDAVGKAGAIFKRGKLDAMVECIQDLFENPEYETKLRIAALDHLKAHHPEIVVQGYLSEIEAVYKREKQFS